MNPTSAEVVVIGAGVMGCAVGRELARRGRQVLILERSVAGAEASSSAAGILGAQAESEEPGPFCELLLRSRSLYPEFVAQLEEQTGVRTGYIRCGALLVACNGAQRIQLDERRAWQRGRGLSAEPLDRSQIEEMEPALGPQVTSGLLLEDDAQIEPPLLARALARGAALSGARFLQTTVRRILHDERRVRAVETAAGRIETDQIVLAAGAWTSQVQGAGLPPGAVEPVRGQVVQLDAQPGLLGRVVIEHGRGYLVPRPDGRILVGSTMEPVGFRKEVTAAGLHGLLCLALDLAPATKDARMGDCWANFRPTTADFLPLLGEGPVAGLFLASGHYRNGILLTPVTAEALGAQMCGEEPPLDVAPFSPRRLLDLI